MKRRLDFGVAAIWILLIIAIEVVARNKRPDWWGWALFVVSATLIGLWIVFRGEATNAK